MSAHRLDCLPYGLLICERDKRLSWKDRRGGGGGTHFWITSGWPFFASSRMEFSLDVPNPLPCHSPQS